MRRASRPTAISWQTAGVSRAFTKEDAPVAPLVTPRAPLPEGATNYVTPQGLAALRDELSGLERELGRLAASLDAPDRASEHAGLLARIHSLEARLASAVLVDPAGQPRDEVRFGARVTVRSERGEERHYRIVGVDEADARRGAIAFVAPLARALLGKRVGEVAILRTPQREEELEVVFLSYD
jgi:transcription elongation factor GreB